MTKFISETVNGTERWLEFAPAWDKRPKTKSEPNYGVHGAELSFAVKRGKVTVVWRLMLPWMLPQVYEWWHSRGLPGRNEPYDGLGSVNYHSPVPMYEGHSPIADCAYTGGDCYCDGSRPISGEWFQQLVAEGPNKIWSNLEEWLNTYEDRAERELADKRNFT